MCKNANMALRLTNPHNCWHMEMYCSNYTLQRSNSIKLIRCIYYTSCCVVSPNLHHQKTCWDAFPFKRHVTPFEHCHLQFGLDCSFSPALFQLTRANPPCSNTTNPIQMPHLYTYFSKVSILRFSLPWSI
jgi:hypothetical protein